MNFDSLLNKSLCQIKALSRIPKNVVKEENLIITKESSIQPIKKDQKKIKYRFVSAKEAKFAKEIGYSFKNQSPKQISDTLKLISIILTMHNDDIKWTRDPLYYAYAHIIDSVIVVIDGKRVLQHRYLQSEYADMTYQSLKNKIDNLVKKLKRNEYILIGSHQKNFARYSKDFKLHLTYGRILRKCNSENSLRCKEELTHSLSNGKMPIEDHNISFLEKVKYIYDKIFNKIFNFENRKEKHIHYNYFNQVHQQQKQITSDLIFTISDMGKFQFNIGNRQTKTLTYVWTEKRITNKGRIIHVIRGRDKKIKELYKEIFRTVKTMKFSQSKSKLDSALALIKSNSLLIKDILLGVERDSFTRNPSKPQKPQPIIINEFQQQEEKIVKLFNRKLSMTFAMLKNFIFDHKKKIFKLKDDAGQRMIKEKIKQFQCMYENEPVIIRFDNAVYHFIV
ncbi:MAG: hypothetical protein RI930_376 [Pseudomonadota bacterium]|jgi:protein-tyrosine-phosphatase